MNIELLLTGFDPSNIPVSTSIAPLLIGALIAGAVSLIVGVYTFLQMRKMQKKNRPKPNQLDGTIADEGISFYDLAGSPHVHANITDIWDKSTKAIKKKSGGFLGIGSSSQVTGYRYYANFLAFIGNRIEDLLAINFDKRGWETGRQVPMGENGKMLYIHLPNIYGENEGGVSGALCLKYGSDAQSPDPAYKKYTDSFSSFAPAYPFQSYISFSGFELASRFSQLSEAELQVLADQYNDGIIPGRGFYLGNSGYMKEMLLWVKRTRVRNDGRAQWYEVRGDGAIVCEIDAESSNMDPSFDPSWKYKHNPVQYRYKSSFNNIWNNEESYNYNNNYILEFATSGTSTGVQQLESGALEMHLNYEGLDGWAEFIVTLLGMESDVKIESIFWPNVYELNLIESDVHKVYSLKLRVENTIGTLSINFSRTSIPGTKFDVTLSTGPIYPYFYNGPALQAYDINPIHKIREILTDDTAMGKPEVDVNDVNFIKAADRIWDEGLGVSWAIDEKSCIDAIEELCYHTEAGIRVNRQTGLYEIVLFRDDWFEESEIHTITENKIKDLSLEVMNSDDIVNQLNVTYYDRGRIKNSTFSIYENGSILTMGHANTESVEFPYFMNMRNAEIVANWKLKQYSTPAWKGTLTTGWREARKWNRYDLVKINWSKKWQGTILARIMKIDLGNGLNNEVMIDFEEVVPYSGEMNASIVVDDSTEEKAEPAKPAIGETFEAPYYIAVQNIGQRKVDEELAYNQDVGFTFSTYRRPQWNALYTEITTANADKPEDGWIIDGNAEFVTSGQFDQLVSRTMTQIPVKNLQIKDSLNQGDLIVVGSWIIGNVGQYEFMIIESFDAETSILTVKRGALDTIPFEWGVDTNFWNSSPDDGLFSLTEYSAGQNVIASALTVTPSSKLEQLGSTPVYMRSRAIRPYPPANVKINGEYWPADIENNLVITWSDRNRLNLNIIDWYSPSVAIEQNTQTHLTISQLDESQIELATSNANVSGATSYTMPISSMQADTRFVKVTLKTVRDGYGCLQPFEHIFELSQFFSAPYDLTVEFKND